MPSAALRDASISEDDAQWISNMVESSGAGEQTKALANDYIQDALSQLTGLPSGSYRDSMEGLAEFVLVRAV